MGKEGALIKFTYCGIIACLIHLITEEERWRSLKVVLFMSEQVNYTRLGCINRGRFPKRKKERKSGSFYRKFVSAKNIWEREVGGE